MAIIQSMSKKELKSNQSSIAEIKVHPGPSLFKPNRQTSNDENENGLSKEAQKSVAQSQIPDRRVFRLGNLAGNPLRIPAQFRLNEQHLTRVVSSNLHHQKFGVYGQYSMKKSGS